MSFVNWKQCFFSALVLFTILSGIQIISHLSSLVDVEVDGRTKSYSMGEKKNVNPLPDFSKITARYDLLQPEPDVVMIDVNDSNNDIEKPQVKAIDKTLKPDFIGLDEEHQMGLVAIFDKPSNFAVVELINYESGVSEYKKVVLGAELGAYKLMNINKLSVTFVAGDSVLELVMFKPN